MKIKKSAAALLILSLLAALLIAFSDKAKEGAAYGAGLSGEIIIPSLLPLLIIFNLIINTPAGRAAEKITAPVTEHILRLPRAAGACILMGLIGGYPVGALLTERIYKNGDIDAETARRIMRFNINGGAAFIITAVGSSMLGSRKSGVILFCSTTTSALILAATCAFFYKKENGGPCSYLVLKSDEALNKSTESAVKSVLTIAAYIIFFNAFSNIFSVSPQLIPLLEITSGTANSAGMLTLPELAFFLTFSGMCIHLQLLPIIKSFGMKYPEFLLWRLLHSGVSYAVCTLLVKIFPIESEVFSNYSENIIRLTSVNASLSVLMVLGCAVFIFDLSGRRKKY